MKTTSSVLLLCLCLVGLIGCYTADSGNYATNQIHCEFSVDVSDTVATATASFWTPGAQPANPTYLVLTANDTITVNGVAMQRKRGPLFDIYTATLQPAEAYVFTFTRSDDESYDSTVPTIPALTITNPEAETWVSRDEDLDIRWSNPIEDGNVTVFMPASQYLNGLLEAVQDVGEYTIAAGTLTLDEMSPETDVRSQISVSRRHQGVMAEGLNGNIIARTGDTVEFISTQ